MSKVEEIQSILGVNVDGIWGPHSQAALDAVILAKADHGNFVMASSFADAADLAAFARCKREGGYTSKGVWHPGGSDEHCFQIGDNGQGYWGDDTKKGSGPSCAMRVSDIEKKWGPIAGGGGHLKQVRVTIGGKQAVCLVKDILGTPGRIDLNPDACEALGLTPPVMQPAIWEWA